MFDTMLETTRSNPARVLPLRRSVLLLIAGIACAVSGCSKEPAKPTPTATPVAQNVGKRDPLVGGPYPTLLLAKAQFEYHFNAQGQRKPYPGPGKLVLVRETEDGWREVVLEDPACKVFHKAMVFDIDGGGPGILSISGTEAALKFWRWENNNWTVKTLWQPHFGGQWDRLRDIEIGDVTGDGKPDMVIGTHDQGVVAVLQKGAQGWTVSEVHRAPNTFVHEVEIGDVDGDGVNEFFTTPSQPNPATFVSQPGNIIMYRWNGKGFDRSLIAAFEHTHAKEILAVDLDGNGEVTLLASVEAQTERRGSSLRTIRPVEIKAYRVTSKGVVDQTITTLNDTQCRFLSAGDLDRDGRVDVVAAGMRCGLWLLRRDANGQWSKSLIDAQSSGYEHAALVCDLEGKGFVDLFVASDVQGELRRYHWQDGGFHKEVIASLPNTEITFNLTAGRL